MSVQWFWFEEDIKTLEQMLKDGKSYDEIAVVLGRTYGSISAKSHRLGFENVHRVNVGETNGQWRGNTVGYKCLHKWLRRNKPQPERCEICGVKRERLDCANISGDYRRDVDDYIYICRRCHMKTDGRIYTWNLKRIAQMKGVSF